MRLHLTPGYVRPWSRSGGTWARGSAVAPDGAVLEGAELAAWLDGPAGRLADRVRLLSGTFAAVCDDGAAVALAADRIRSIPLVYGRDAAGAWCASDDGRWLARAVGARLDRPVAAAEYLLQGCVVGPDSLSSSVQGVQAAEVVVLTGAGANSVRYARYADGPRLDGSPDELEAEGVRGLDRAFERLLASVRGRPVAVPLSGGIDSRLVAAMFVRGGRTDAVCYTYGRARSFEARASRRVARALGLRWRFVPYGYRDWHRWAQTDAYQRYRRTAGGLVSIEHEQDWPAVAALRQRGELEPGAVVVPGHAGDFLGGSHLSPSPGLGSAEGIVGRYYHEWPRHGLSPETAGTLAARVRAQLDGAEGAPALLRFGWQERQAKVIAHSVRVYEDHGLDWRLPFWADADVVDFWGRVPTPLLHGRRLYDRVLRRMLGGMADLPSTLGRRDVLAGALRRRADADLRRYGMWLGPSPLTGALRLRVGDLARLDHPVVGPVAEALVRPVARGRLSAATVNGLLALDQLGDLARELG